MTTNVYSFLDKGGGSTYRTVHLVKETYLPLGESVSPRMSVMMMRCIVSDREFQMTAWTEQLHLLMCL